MSKRKAILKDPFYGDIFEGLAGHIDPLVFDTGWGTSWGMISPASFLYRAVATRAGTVRFRIPMANRSPSSARREPRS